MVRWTAYKIKPEEFLENEVVDKCIILDGKKIHRVRILGEVKNILTSSILSFELDSGIIIKDFDKKGDSIRENDFIDVIGRVNNYNDSKYIALELFVKRNDNREKWKELRDLEIEKTRKYMEDEEQISKQQYNENYEREVISDDILENIYGGGEDIKDNILRNIDEKGEVSYEELLEISKIDEKELDKILDELLEDGEIYEPKTGVYRIL
ncbi:winged helix-turn-helix domain-containing protein [Methanothermococcus sp. SCGC AD-155-C09]|nr:winged helix-turn-helix domain-containing protein [Methanothermococcus sp. SCGC AD-155-C09]